MIKFIFSSLLFFTISTQAQTADSLIGNWKFKDLYKPENLDSAKKENLRRIFSEMNIELKPGNQYTSSFMSKDEGTWSYDPDLRQLILITDQGEDRINIIAITNNTLTLEMKKGKSLILEKVLPH